MRLQKKNLKEDSVWLADPSTFNDPYDCAYALDIEYLNKKYMSEYFGSKDCNVDLSAGLMKEIISSENPFSKWADYMFREEPEERRDAIQSQLEALQRKMSEDFATYSSRKNAGNFKVCSFSERKDSLLMWAHYADNHKGFCLEYDIKSMSYRDLRRRFMYPVIYSEKMFDATDYMHGNVKDGRNVLHLNLAALTKAIDWRYEKEWRLVFSNGVLLMPQKCYIGKPTHLYLGSKMEDTDQEDLIDICKSKEIPYSMMRPHHREFKVEPVSLHEAKNAFIKSDA